MIKNQRFDEEVIGKVLSDSSSEICRPESAEYKFIPDDSSDHSSDEFLQLARRRSEAAAPVDPVIANSTEDSAMKPPLYEIPVNEPKIPIKWKEIGVNALHTESKSVDNVSQLNILEQRIALISESTSDHIKGLFMDFKD